METKLRKDEELLAAHLAAICVASFLFLGLMTETLVMGWEIWAIPFLLVAIFVMLFCHFTRFVPMEIPPPLYVLICLGAFFFYGVHPDSLFDIPIIAIIMQTVFMTLDCVWAIYTGVAVYALILVWHFFILRTIGAISGPLEISRLCMDIVSVTVATLSTKDVVYRRRKSKKNVQAAVESLKEVNRQTEDFMANVSHELRTPINAVTGISESLLKKEDDAQKRSELLAIKRAGHRLYGQISDILDYTEIGMRRLKVSESPYSIVSCINDVISDLRDFDYKPSVELILDVDIRIPAVMLGDEGKIKKILRHLIENSLKFTQEGGVYVKLSTLKRDYGANLLVSVCDTGIGMSDEQLSKVFAKLYQADSDRTRRSSGIGLGLTVTSSLVRSMGGFIRVESEIGKGTEVNISIPQKVSDPSPSMSISNERSLCVVYYFRQDKFGNPLVRDYYERMISTIQKSLQGMLIRAPDMAGLERICQTYPVTHLYTSEVEYGEAREFFDRLSARLTVAVVVGRNFEGRSLGTIPIIKKPLFSVPLVNVLNGDYVPGEGELPQHFICPGLRVLVVDDDEMNLMVAEGVLKDYQMDVTLALSGREAVELCQKQNFDLVFLDHMMPEMDGVECLHILRKLNSHAEKEMVAIALTANAASGAREFFLGEGFDEFISKPIELMMFERALRRALPISRIQYTGGESGNPSEPSPLPAGGPLPGSGVSGLDYGQLLSALRDSLDTLEADRAALILRRLDELRPGGKSVEEILPGGTEAVENLEFDGLREKVSALIGGGLGGKE
ncbi:MAG: response regulator [Treponema sp.]|nr:response regulator [Treponema sp.]